MVIVYGHEDCTGCKKAKEFLKERGIPFEYFDVMATPGNMVEFNKRTGAMSVPVIDVDGTLVFGFKPKELDLLL